MGSALQRASGRGREEWFAALDQWGAAGRPYKEIADWLTGQGLSDWWAQKVIVEYEQERGLRAPGVRRDGTFTVTASKTFAVPVERVFDCLVDDERRLLWLDRRDLIPRAGVPGRSARFECADGTRVNFSMASTRGEKTQVAVEQTRLADAQTAAAAKDAWRNSLAALKCLLET